MLVLDNLSLRIGGRLLVEAASVQIPSAARVGLVGRNGAGKTTLLRAIAGDLGLDGGAVRRPQRARIGRLAQEAPDGPATLLSTVLAADDERTQLLAEAEQTGDPIRIAEIQTRLADIGAHSAPARAAAILAGLGFDAADQQRACAEFSGGWRMRVALAALLFSEPDILLLDEPTNYLDLEGTLWLHDHLARYRHTVIVISHDRDLLDQSVDYILHLDGGRLTLYRGSYSSFEKRLAERQVQDQKFAKQQEAERRRISAFVERFGAKASKARQAQSRLKALARMQTVTVRTIDAVRPIRFPAPERQLSPPILALNDVAVGYAPGEPVLRRVTLRIDTEDRIALIGQNGNGKSTLAKLLAGRLRPLSGELVGADRLGVGYFAQHQLDELRATDSAYGHFRRLMPDAPETKLRSLAGGMGFSGEAADTPVAMLSGGEKARLLLGLAALSGPHLLILDEPTNHLDIDSRAVLIRAINEFPGAVLLVSHDRYLLDACVERLWLVADRTVASFDGDLADYHRVVMDVRKDAGRAQANAEASERGSRAALRRDAALKRAELAPLKSRVAAAEAAMTRFAAAIKQIDAELAASDLFGRNPQRAAILAKTRHETAAALAAAEDEWLAASAAYEAAMA